MNTQTLLRSSITRSASPET